MELRSLELRSLKAGRGKRKRGFQNEYLIQLLAQTYLINTCEAFKGVNKISLSFGEAFLGREKTLTAIMSSHEREIAAWLLPKVFPAPLVVSFHQLSYKNREIKPPISPPGSDPGAFQPGDCSSIRP